jgi:hypothetical protein
MKTIIIALSLAALVIPAEAAKGRAAAPRLTKRDKQEIKRENKQEQKEREERQRQNEAVRKVLESKDGNHDGSLTRDEYLLGEADKEAAGRKFDSANKNGDRFLSKSEIEGSLGF